VAVSPAGTQWLGHKDARLGAALAYYSVCSLGPLIVIAVAVAGLLFGQDAVRGEVTGSLKGLLSASKPHEGIIATIIGLGTLVFAAVGVVVQQQESLAARPPAGASPRPKPLRLLRFARHACAERRSHGIPTLDKRLPLRPTAVDFP